MSVIPSTVAIASACATKDNATPIEKPSELPPPPPAQQQQQHQAHVHSQQQLQQQQQQQQQQAQQPSALPQPALVTQDDESEKKRTGLRLDRTTTSTSNYSLASPRLYTSPSLVSSVTARVDLGPLDHDEQVALEAEITARRAARRSRRRKHYADTDDEDDHVAIGTKVSEGHRNYHLMYDMLTGIRIAVGRVSAKIRRDPTKEDFQRAHKLVFDVTGNELTPGVKYDFKFKDYAPWVFRNLRELFHIDAADYLMSLTHKYILSELGSPGKSGSFFYYSRDYRYIIKTIHKSEHVFMRRILTDYYQYVRRNPNTLLCRIYGLHRIKLPRGRKIHFMVMGNVFPANNDVHETYDLKGSTFGRWIPEDEIAHNPHAVMKDLNWVRRAKQLELGPEKSQMLMAQLEKDVELLTQLHIMDYSLLIGIHDFDRGNCERYRDQRLQLVEAHATVERRPSRQRSIKYTTNPVTMAGTPSLSANLSEERKHCIFYADNGGYQSSNCNDQATTLLYYFGVIDILTPYNWVKKTEHAWKSITQDKGTISSVPPDQYGRRFLAFMRSAIAPSPLPRSLPPVPPSDPPSPDQPPADEPAL